MKKPRRILLSLGLFLLILLVGCSADKNSNQQGMKAAVVIILVDGWL